MLVPRVGSCITCHLPGSSAPCVLRVECWVGEPSAPSFRLRCSLVQGSLPAQLGRWSGRGFVLVPVSAVGRVLPSSPFMSSARRRVLCASLRVRVPA